MRHDLEVRAQQPGVRNDFDQDVDKCTQAAAHQDDPQPERVGTPADEMHDRNHHQNNAVAVVAEEMHE